MKIPPFDASRHYDSDDMCLIILWLLDGEILKFNNHFLELLGYFWQVSVYVKIPDMYIISIDAVEILELRQQLRLRRFK